MKKPLISFRNFSFRYNSQSSETLTDIDLDIFEGETILIAGPSGSGKSTLGHCLNGLIPNAFKGETKGSLWINETSAAKQSIFDLSKQVGTVLQDTDAQFIGLTVGEDIAFSLENDGCPQAEMFKRVSTAANRVGMADYLDHSPHDLSGGQKQRVSFAGILVDPVRILLFDEPLANLDPAAGRQTMELIDRIHKESGLTVIIIEHRLEDVLEIAVDRIVLMQEGKIIADKRPAQLLSTDLLQTCGLREPLYLTAAKKAGVQITPDLHPESLESFAVDQVKKPLLEWCRTRPPRTESPKYEPILTVEHLSFGYQPGSAILSDLSLAIGKGERLAIVGKNGAGKSTLTKLICGLERPVAGTLFFSGEKNMESWTIQEHARHIGLVMQNPNQMISQRMIFDEVAFGLRIRGARTQTIQKKVLEILKICGLYPFRNWPISALSFGQKKRVTIASILVLEPEVLVLDEPTAGQDYRHYTEIMQFLDALNRKGMTIVMITHDMQLMLEYTDRAIVLVGGKIIGNLTPAELLSNEKLAAQASLKTTSLFRLAERMQTAEPLSFVEHFIHANQEERAVHEHENAQLY
ncbi:MAG: ABC transporter ATP-binding protein [Sporolactobacillus sp.]